MTVGLVASGAWGATAAVAAPSVNPADQAASPVTRAPSKAKGTVVVERSRPGATIVLTAPSGRKISLSTSKAIRKKIPAGKYAISVIGLPGHRVVVNKGRSTISVRPKRLTKLDVKVTRLASVRLESVTTDGVSTTARVAASKAVQVQVEFLDASGKAISQRTISIKAGARSASVTVDVVASQVRARPLSSPGESGWVSLAPQASLLATSRPDISVEAGSVEIEAPTSGTVTSVDRVNSVTGAVVGDVSATTEDGALVIEDEPAPGDYEYRITGVNKAGESTTTTLAVGVPDESGDGLAVMAPNTRRITVTSIEYPKSGSGPVAIPLSALPAGTQASDLIGNPIIAATAAGTSTAVGIVVEIRNQRIWLEQTGLHTLFQQTDSSGFTANSPRILPRSQVPRLAKLKCSLGGLEFTGPRVNFGVEGPDSDWSRWRIYDDGADLHIEGNVRMKAELSLSAFAISSDLLECSLENLPMLAVVNINIPSPVGPIPTVLTAKPFLDLEASVAAEFGTYSRSIELAAEFNVSNGWNGPKLHTPNPFTLTGKETPAQVGAPSASVSLRGGLDFAYGFGQGFTSFGVQVGGLSVKAGPKVSLDFSSGLAAGKPESLACLRGELTLATATVHMQGAEAWVGPWSKTWGDVTLFELPGLTLASETIKCWGDPPPYVDSRVEGDMDGDGIRDKISFKVTKKSFPVEGRLTVTASSTGKTSSITLGAGDVQAQGLSLDGTAHVDGRRGTEALVSGVGGGGAYRFRYVVALVDGRLRLVATPGPVREDGNLWFDTDELWAVGFYLRRVEAGSVILSDVFGEPRTPSSRDDEALTITQYRWTSSGWVEIDREDFALRYPLSIKRSFDFSPYGSRIA